MPSEKSGRELYWRLAIVMLAFAGAYTWYVTTQFGRLNDLNQRELAKAATELKRSLGNAIQTIERFEVETRKKTIGGQGGICEFDDDQPYLTLESPRLCSGQPALRQADGGAPDTRATRRTITLETTAPTGIRVVVAGDLEARFRFRADTLLEELSFPESFDLAFIATEKGEVLFQDTPSRRTWLRDLRWGEQQFRDATASLVPGVTMDRFNEAIGADPASGWTRLTSMSGRTTLDIAGRSHEVYIEPLVLDDKTKLVVAGAVPTEALIRKALAVDSYFLSGLVFVMLLALLGFPFVKLCSLDAHEPFRLRDVMMLYLSTAALLALFTFASQGIDAYVRWYAAADRGLQTLARDIEEDFLDELGVVYKRLDEYDRQIGSLGVERLKTLPLRTGWFDTPETEEENGLAAPDVPTHIEQVFWISPEGRQVWKATADPIARLSNVETRVYFRSVRDGHLFDVIPQASSPAVHDQVSLPEKFYVGPDRSVSDGRFYTFVATTSRLSTGSETYVATASARLLSLGDRALPSGYGFAFINREGRVLYHSDSRLSLRENLFDELSAGARARAMVYAGHEAGFTTRYRERPHEFYFHPVRVRLADQHSLAGFWLVTFRETSREQAAVARVFMLSLLGPMLVLLSLSALSLVAIARVPLQRREQWSVWLWPHGGLVPVYKQISLALVLLLAAAVAIRLATRSDVIYLTVPLLAPVLTVRIYAAGTRGCPSRLTLGSTMWHSVMCVLVLICLIVVPATGLFRAAMAHEFGKIVGVENGWIEAQRADFGARMLADFRAEKRPVAAAKRLIALTEQRVPTAAPPEPFDQPVRKMGRLTHWLLTPFDWLDDVMPLGNRLAPRELYDQSERSYTPPGTLVRPLDLSIRGVLCVVGTLALLAWWIRWKATRLFFADRENRVAAKAGPADLWAACSKDEQQVLVRVAREHIANPHQRPLVDGLLKKGLLMLDPDLRPCTPEFKEYILQQEPELRGSMQEWEAVESGHSWRYVRLVLLASLGGASVFLVATQPGLQSGLIGITSGITAALTAALKLRDVVASWMSNRKQSA